MKSAKKVLIFVLSAMMLFSFAACGGKEEGFDVRGYTNGTKLKSETVNKWQSIYLLTEDTYVVTVKALDSKDPSIVTFDLVMKGNYTMEGNVVTLEPGHGYVTAMNGSNPLEMAITPNSQAMFQTGIGGNFTQFTLNEDGTFTPVE